MKLELKHLAPYLPYGLKVTLLNYPVVGQQVRDFKLDCGHDFHFYMQQGYVRPHLRNLSDLTKEIEHNGERLVPIDILDEECPLHPETIEELIGGNTKILRESLGVTWNYFEKLFEWHFDVFGLIDQGLAIDKNSLEI